MPSEKPYCPKFCIGVGVSLSINDSDLYNSINLFIEDNNAGCLGSAAKAKLAISPLGTSSATINE